MASTYRFGSEALPENNGAPGRPGVNSIAVRKTVIVPPDVLRDLARIAGKLYPGYTPNQPSGDDKKFALFGTRFEAGPSRANSYEISEPDLAGILRAVRQGKQHSDFLVATLHSHEPADTSEPDPKNDFADSPAGFVQTLARSAIDSGADAFMVTGIHHLGPIEIYKGRPIFYGLGDFFWSDIQEPMPADFYSQYRRSLVGAFRNPERATDADLANALNAEGFNGEPPFESVITQSRYDHGQVVEVRLYPVYLGYGMKLTESGIPRVASPEQATKILRRMQEMSKPYGTAIAIQPDDAWHFVGIIHP